MSKKARDQARIDAAVGLMLDRLMFPRKKAPSDPGGGFRKLIMHRP